MKNLFFVSAICAILTSCSPDAERQKQREQEVADSVARALTGRSITDSANIKKMERIKGDSALAKGVIQSDAAGLKNIVVKYDYDNKLFNAKSDIDGRIFNNSPTATYRNIQLQVVCRNKKGVVTKTFIHKANMTLPPHSEHSLRIKFEDGERTKDATVTVIGADEVI